MYDRQCTQQVIQALSHYPAVALLGPRQIGKTTLALALGRDRPSTYLDLENPEDFQKLKEPHLYVEKHADKLIILDEIQRYPDLFMLLRGMIDSRIREGRGHGCFLMLGSASRPLLKQTSESLAGRIQYLELFGLHPLEVQDKPLRHLWLRGGFPKSLTDASDAMSHTWRQNMIRTYLERDIPHRIPATTLGRFWTMLAHAQGECLNASKLGSALGVQGVTIKRYIDILADLMLVRRLEPLSIHIKKRLVKSPRVYVRDSGFLHTLLNIKDEETLLGHPIYGKSWEGFVIESILSIVPSHVHAYFYRTATGAEIDLVLDWGNEYWAIEIKASRTPKLTKGFPIACEDIQAQKRWIIYMGEESFPWDQSTTVLSLPQCLKLLSPTSSVYDTVDK